MTVAYWCVLIAAVIPLLAIGIAKTGAERYNNRNPRVAYFVCYLADWHWARSLVWAIGFVTCAVIFLSGVAPG